MLTYPLSSGVPTGFDYQNKPLHYGMWSDGTNLYLREYSDLFTTSNLSETPTITTLYDGAGLTVGSKFWGATWHNWPNTSTSAIRTSLGGQTMNDMGGSFTTVRSHDYFPNGNGSLHWIYVEPSNDTTYFTNLDKYVNDHYDAGRDIILVLGFTPDWASAASAPAGGSIYGGKSANPPASMADWSDFCSRVATQCNGKVKYYEIWNEPDNSIRWWNGTSANYAQMLRRANQAIKAVDATAKILAPSNAAVNSTGRSWLTNMLAASDGNGGTGATGSLGEKWIDIVTIHQYFSGASNYSTFISDLTSYKAILSSNGLESAEIWCTELGVNSTHSRNGADNITKYLIRMIYLMATQSVARVQLYSADSQNLSPFYFGKDIKGIMDQINTHVNHLINGDVTLVNLLADGRLAIKTSSTNYLI